MIRYAPVQRMSYAASDAIQQSLCRKLLDAKKVKDTSCESRILGFEMDPTYTYGRRQRGNLPVAELQRLRMHCPDAVIVETLRGGHTTFHGPGQLVLYPVLDLQELGVKVREYVCILERSIVSVLEQYNLSTERRTGAGLNGVWIPGTQNKIASVGVHVRRNVTTHGLALNVDVSPHYFAQVVACNLPNARMVSMADYMAPPAVSSVGEELAREVGRRMGCNVHI